jgi:hypothetical protein
MSLVVLEQPNTARVAQRMEIEVFAGGVLVP